MFWWASIAIILMIIVLLLYLGIYQRIKESYKESKMYQSHVYQRDYLG